MTFEVRTGRSALSDPDGCLGRLRSRWRPGSVHRQRETRQQKFRFPASCFATTGTGHSWTLPRTPVCGSTASPRPSIWGDYDSDRFPDLYVSNLGAPNQAVPQSRRRHVRRRGPEQFERDRARNSSFPAWFWDFDNDGSVGSARICLSTSGSGRSPRITWASRWNSISRASTAPTGRATFKTSPRQLGLDLSDPAHGLELRRRGQRRIPRSISRDGQRLTTSA